jgi:hypothetical protein
VRLGEGTYDFGVVEEALLHYFGCAEFVSADEDVDVRAIFRKILTRALVRHKKY